MIGYLRDLAAEVPGVPAHTIDRDSGLQELGIGSLAVVRIGNRLARAFEVDLKPTVQYRCGTIRGLADHMLQFLPLDENAA
jgi:acyl carrier protein